jgi:hypothetical protein
MGPFKLSLIPALAPRRAPLLSLLGLSATLSWAPTAAAEASAPAEAAASPSPAAEPAPVETPPEAKAPEAASAPVVAAAKVLVLPYQPIFRSVPQREAQQATELLNKEIAAKDTLAPIRGAVAEAGAAQASPEQIKAALAEAERLEGEKRIAQAIDARKRALEVIEKNASALESAEDYVLAHHYLARAQMWAGRDDDARATLDVAARMAPGFAVPAESFSRLYRRWFTEAAERVIKEKPGELLVRSVLPGAKISLDGRETDVAPVLLTKAIPGKHLLGARAEGVPGYRTVVTIPAGKKAEFTVNFGGTVGGDAVGDVADAIARNALPKEAVERAAAAGKSVGAAFVVAGGLVKDENHINVHTLLVNVETRQVLALEPVEFDQEMLTAESDVLRVVRSIDAATRSFAGGQPQLAVLDKKAREQKIVNEVSAAASLKTEARGPAKAGEKKETRKVFGPLKGGTIEIKD